MASEHDVKAESPDGRLYVGPRTILLSVVAHNDSAFMPEVLTTLGGISKDPHADIRGVMIVVGARVETPNAAIRGALHQMFSCVANFSPALCICVLGTGVFASTKRTVARLVAAVASSKIETHISGTIAEAAGWIATGPGGLNDAAHADVLVELCAEHQSTASISQSRTL